MRKIMFNDRYGLTAATLRGDKTMMRRIVKCPKKFQGVEDIELEFHRRWGQDIYYDCVVVDANGHELGQLVLPYEVGDVVAIAQSYETLANSRYCSKLGMMDSPTTFKKEFCGSGWGNKMFVKAEYMPHRIRITDLWFERLQDVSDEDCLKEGLLAGTQEPKMYGFKLPKGTVLSFMTPRDAFAALIDRISGRGTWDSNPWVIAYTYELVKED